MSILIEKLQGDGYDFAMLLRVLPEIIEFAKKHDDEKLEKKAKKKLDILLALIECGDGRR